jgi:hypothetical protein
MCDLLMVNFFSVLVTTHALYIHYIPIVRTLSVVKNRGVIQGAGRDSGEPEPRVIPPSDQKGSRRSKADTSDDDDDGPRYSKKERRVRESICELIECDERSLNSPVCGLDYTTGKIVGFKSDCDMQKYNCRRDTGTILFYILYLPLL